MSLFAGGSKCEPTDKNSSGESAIDIATSKGYGSLSKRLSSFGSGGARGSVQLPSLTAGRRESMRERQQRNFADELTLVRHFEGDLGGLWIPWNQLYSNPPPLSCNGSSLTCTEGRPFRSWRALEWC